MARRIVELLLSGAKPARTAGTKAKKTRKPSRYNVLYGKHFRKIQGKYKKKNGQWKKDGFKRAGAEARRLTKKELKR